MHTVHVKWTDDCAINSVAVPTERDFYFALRTDLSGNVYMLVCDGEDKRFVVIGVGHQAAERKTRFHTAWYARRVLRLSVSRVKHAAPVDLCSDATLDTAKQSWRVECYKRVELSSGSLNAPPLPRQPLPNCRLFPC